MHPFVSAHNSVLTPSSQIPTFSMLASLIHVYVSNNALTPTYILILFIVSVLAAGWTIYTLFSYHRSHNNARFVAFVDLCFVGSLIGAVYQLRFINSQSCGSATSDAFWNISFVTATGTDSVSPQKTCGLLKASFAFGIMNILIFFITSFLAYVIGRRKAAKEVVREETHHSRHSHRRSGSHRSHRSSRSDRSRSYV
jgi:hypothetical protein